MMMLLLFCDLLLLVSVYAIPFHNNHHGILWRRYRGGSSSTEELTLEEKVHAAMRKLGIQPVAEESSPTTENAVAANPSPVLTAAMGSAPAEDTAATATPAQGDAAAATPSSSSGSDTSDDPFATAGGASCTADGVCTAPPVVAEDEEPVTATTDVAAAVEKEHAVADDTSTPAPPPSDEDPETMATRIAESMGVDPSLAWAALAATSTEPDSGDRRILDETKARAMLQQEKDMVEQIPEDSAAVQQLLTEGFENRFLVRRALAFADQNLEDARAILQAEMDEEEEEEEEPVGVAPIKPMNVESSFKTVNVEAGFDPTAPPPAAEQAPPAPASRESVVFDVTTAEVFDVALQSPVPVLLDIYADWCGPCKALSPILEEMAMKSGGAFRLVKVNTDNEQAVSSALDVTSLPTVFGIRDGKIVHMFQGMPRSEQMMKNFMMGLLMPGQAFDPPVTADEQEKYDDWTRRLIKTATAASYSFGARERLQDRTKNQLDAIVEQTGDVFDAEASAKVLRSLLSNVMQDPFATKFRTVKLDNKVIRAKVAKYPGALAILKSVGFKKHKSNSNLLVLGDGSSKLINTAPLTAARDAIDKWIDKKRYEVARAARKRKDDADKVHVQAELEAAAKEEEKRRAEEEAEQAEAVDPNLCQLKLRLEGKKKVHSIALDGDTPLSQVLMQLPRFSSNTECQILCVAKRLVVSSTDADAMQQSLRDHGLFPTASLVIKPTSATAEDSDGTAEAKKPSLAERAAARKKLKRGSHTMQSIGIYAKDDNAKGELIDGGGGVLYEQDVSDDEEEEVAPETSEATDDDSGENESVSSDTEANAVDEEADTDS